MNATTARPSERISFNLLRQKDGSRARQQASLRHLLAYRRMMEWQGA